MLLSTELYSCTFQLSFDSLSSNLLLTLTYFDHMQPNDPRTKDNDQKLPDQPIHTTKIADLPSVTNQSQVAFTQSSPDSEQINNPLQTDFINHLMTNFGKGQAPVKGSRKRAGEIIHAPTHLQKKSHKRNYSYADVQIPVILPTENITETQLATPLTDSALRIDSSDKVAPVVKDLYPRAESQAIQAIGSNAKPITKTSIPLDPKAHNFNTTLKSKSVYLTNDNTAHTLSSFLDDSGEEPSVKLVAKKTRNTDKSAVHKQKLTKKVVSEVKYALNTENADLQEALTTNKRSKKKNQRATLSQQFDLPDLPEDETPVIPTEKVTIITNQAPAKAKTTKSRFVQQNFTVSHKDPTGNKANKSNKDKSGHGSFKKILSSTIAEELPVTGNDALLASSNADITNVDSSFFTHANTTKSSTHALTATTTSNNTSKVPNQSSKALDRKATVNDASQLSELSLNNINLSSTSTNKPALRTKHTTASKQGITTPLGMPSLPDMATPDMTQAATKDDGIVTFTSVVNQARRDIRAKLATKFATKANKRGTSTKPAIVTSVPGVLGAFAHKFPATKQAAITQELIASDQAVTQTLAQVTPYGTPDHTPLPSLAQLTAQIQQPSEAPASNLATNHLQNVVLDHAKTRIEINRKLSPKGIEAPTDANEICITDLKSPYNRNHQPTAQPQAPTSMVATSSTTAVTHKNMPNYITTTPDAFDDDEQQGMSITDFEQKAQQSLIFNNQSDNNNLNDLRDIVAAASLVSDHHPLAIDTQEVDQLSKEVDSLREVQNEELQFQQAFQRKYHRSPRAFILGQIIQASSLMNPILSVLLGTTLSLYVIENVNYLVLTAMILTTILVQIFSNLCKEYSIEEIGSRYEFRLVENNLVRRVQIYRFTQVTLLFATVSGVSLIYLAHLTLGPTLVFAGLGILTVNILLRYSVGDNPYSFTILGEISYLFVYGLLMVSASFYLQVHEFDNLIIFPAIACGLCTVADLNIVNMRDSYVTALNHKNNFATFLGTKASRMLQTILYVLALILYTYFNNYFIMPWYSYAYFISVPFIIYHLYVIHKDVKSRALHRQKYLTRVINILMTGTFTLTTFLNISGYLK